MINFEKLTAEGFGSIIKKKEFLLNQEGLNILRGKVGAGKTSIPSIVYWVIYGQTLKKGSTVQTWEELRDESFKGTFGKIDFRVDKDKYAIIRCIQYKGTVFEKQKGGSKIIITKNGKEIKPKDVKGKKNIQAFINEIIGYSPELFINSIIYGQRLKRIVEESGPNKKKLFDEAFETVFIQRAKVKTSDRLKETNHLIDELLTKESSLVDQLESIDEVITNWEDLRINFNSNKTERLKAINDELNELSTQEKSNQKELDSIKLVGRESEYDKQLVTISGFIKDNKSNIGLYEELKSEFEKWDDKLNSLKSDKLKITNKKCSRCESVLVPLKQDELLREVNKKIAKITKIRDNTKIKLQRLNIKVLNKLSEDYKKRADSIKDKILKIKSLTRVKELLEDSQERILKQKTNLKQKRRNIKFEVFEDKSLQSKNKRDKLKTKLDKTQEQLKVVNKERDLLKWLVKEPLSDSGIKAYIFNTLLSQVNDKLKEYSEILGFRVEFGIDMETSAKDFYQVIYKDDIIINYPDLSGGQKQLVDTAIALSIHDVISGLKPVNILFLDEPFEGLDADTIDIVSDIISYKAQSKSLFLITHHPTFNPTNSRTIYFSLDKDGNTVID